LFFRHDFNVVYNCGYSGPIVTLLINNSTPLSLFSQQFTMSEEKSNLLESQEDEPVFMQRNKPFTRIWSLFLCAILATAWFSQPHLSCSPLSIEERVQKILSQTPLIGKELQKKRCL